MSLLKKINKGFTLIELMITVTIVAVLAGLSITAYQDYTVRAQLSEGLIFSSNAKIGIMEYFSNNSRMPRNAEQAGIELPKDVNNIFTMYIDRGVIVTTFNGNNHRLLKNRILLLSPRIVEENNVVWDCQSTVGAKYLPNSCATIASDLGEAKISNPVSSLLYTLNQRMRWFNAYNDAYEKGVLIIPKSEKDEQGSLVSKGANSLEQLLTNSYMIKLFVDGLRQDGYPETLLPKVPEIKLKSAADSEEAKRLLSNYFGSYYDGSVYWEHD